MFSGIRSNLQASVDSRRDVLHRLIDTVPVLINEHFDQLDSSFSEIASDYSGGDVDIELSVYKNLADQARIEERYTMINDFYKSMVMLVCSFAETTLKSMLADPSVKFKSSYICCAYKQLRDDTERIIPKIGQIWKDHLSFIQLRNDIAHNRADRDIDSSFLHNNLDCIHALLRTVADAKDQLERIKNNEEIPTSVNYLWRIPPKFIKM